MENIIKVSTYIYDNKKVKKFWNKFDSVLYVRYFL